MKKYIYYFITITLLVIVLSCNNDSKKTENKEQNQTFLTFDGTDIYYFEAISEEEVNTLGQFLIDSHFTNGNKLTVYIDKFESTYQFKIPVKKGTENIQEYVNYLELLANQISSSVFKGEEVEIHLLDNDLELLRIIEMVEGVTLGYNKRDIDGISFQYDNNISESEVENLKKFIVEQKYLKERITSVLYIYDFGAQIIIYVSEDLYNNEDFITEVKKLGQDYFDKYCEYENLQVQVYKDGSVSYIGFTYKV